MYFALGQVKFCLFYLTKLYSNAELSTNKLDTESSNHINLIMFR